jgi:hypothetical protein
MDSEYLSGNMSIQYRIEQAQIDSVFFLPPRIGRDINISKRVGIGIDLGINIVHYLYDPSVPYFLSLYGLPGLGIRVFCRI